MLTIKDTMTLDFEGSWWKYSGAKDSAIADLFSETATRYYQRLSVLVDRPESMEYSPMTVARLRRLRDSRARSRSVRRVGFSVE